MDSPSSNTC